MASSKNKWLALLNIPIQMGLTIFIFIKIGEFVQEEYEIEYAKKIAVLLGVFISFVLVYNQVKRLND